MMQKKTLMNSQPLQMIQENLKTNVIREYNISTRNRRGIRVVCGRGIQLCKHKTGLYNITSNISTRKDLLYYTFVFAYMKAANVILYFYIQVRDNFMFIINFEKGNLSRCEPLYGKVLMSPF